MSKFKKHIATFRKGFFLLCVILIALLSIAAIVIASKDASILNPAGAIAVQQRDLMTTTILLMCIVVIPVFALLIFIPIQFRETNKKASYTPNWDHHRGLELVWWGVPIIIIATLAVITWTSSHSLDPYKTLESDKKPVAIQVVALQWKWLFIYPDYGVATVNHLYIPEKRPVNFTITADAPMNSFWIPQLGGQVYAMSGMSTKLHLIADKQGTYHGSSANLSGEGFSDMHFKTTASSQQSFSQWVDRAQQSKNDLSWDSYEKLHKKSIEAKPLTYRLSEKALYDKIVMKYMNHSSSSNKQRTIRDSDNETVQMCRDMPEHCQGVH